MELFYMTIKYNIIVPEKEDTSVFGIRILEEKYQNILLCITQFKIDELAENELQIEYHVLNNENNIDVDSEEFKNFFQNLMIEILEDLLTNKEKNEEH